MWQMRMDMSRDECRKCLRCLELDAYGNMVSVLRAQGPFTEDKKRLLAELAKVLHISNERHRAEVRRAVNDEKLSVIAEQLNGPNTWTDWAIEGRRTIPLLPRLKAHTAFTGLANSLSLVIATANEKKVPFDEKKPEPVVKAETEPQPDLVLNERIQPKPLMTQPKTRGRKRKKSQDNYEDLNNLKFITNDINHGASTIVNEFNCNLRNTPSPLPVNSVEILDVNEASNLSESPDNVEKLNDTPIKCTVSPEKSHNNDSTNKIICQLDLNRASSTASTEDNCNIELDALKRINDAHNLHDSDGDKKIEISGDERVPSEEIVKMDLEIEEESEDASNVQRIESTNNQFDSMSLESIVTNKLDEIEENKTNCAESSGPGPPESVDGSLDCNHSTIKFNDQCVKKNEIKLNSNKMVNLTAMKSSRLGSKANVIVVRKGLKLARKEVLGKVIVDEKNLRLSKPVVLLPHRTLPNNNDESINSNSKAVDTVILDIRQDKLDNHDELINHEALINHEVIDDNSIDNVDGINSRTILLNTIEEQSEEDCHDNIIHMDVVSEDMIQNIVADGDEIVVEHVEDTENCNNITAYENCVEEETIEISEEPICGEILIEQDAESVIIDAQTEIYNFESTDDQICEIQIEDTVPESRIELFTTQMTSDDINCLNFTYETEETVTLTDDDNATVHRNIEELNKFDA